MPTNFQNVSPMTEQPHKLEYTLDPDDWDQFRAQAHRMLDAAIHKMERAREGRVWTPLPDEQKPQWQTALPTAGHGLAATQERIEALLPYGVGNTHPRFFGWVHGSGTPGNLLADMAAAAMNANLGGRDHGAMYVEKQVVSWCRELFQFPPEASGLVVSGTSMATVVAMKVARDRQLGFGSRKQGVGAAKLVGYTSSQAHACVGRAFDLLGLGADALRQVPVNDRFEIDVNALKQAIAQDRAAGLEPFVVIGTAGTVNVGAIDDLDDLANLAAAEGLWFHVDGAFGACGVLSDRLRPRLSGLERADSLAMDFHKWMHVNYDAGLVLIRSEEAHRRAFSDRPDYLKAAERGLAAGNPWPVEYGPELSRGFRALKIWTQLHEHGTAKLGELVTQNCEQAAYLASRVADHASLELLAPVAMNICCFRYTDAQLTPAQLNALNDEVVVQLQLQGIAAPSSTVLQGQTAIRVNITNHRTRFADLDLLVAEVNRIAEGLAAEMTRG